MGLFSPIAFAVLACLVLWWAFPVLARIGGFLLTVDSLAAIAFLPERALPDKLAWLGLGVVVWLAGHWAWAFKHRAWASVIALRFFSLPGLRWTRPRRSLIIVRRQRTRP
ncbi:hypothetical protein AB0H76_09860 [Nocardia sp. NPDC050712]|uniref:hypothetical protein n=1 Tax=Nocardia sp. NPDC050712 TaxID=3155518 RepID=UPI0033FFBDD5